MGPGLQLISVPGLSHFSPSILFCWLKLPKVALVHKQACRVEVHVQSANLFLQKIPTVQVFNMNSISSMSPLNKITIVYYCAVIHIELVCNCSPRGEPISVEQSIACLQLVL